MLLFGIVFCYCYSIILYFTYFFNIKNNFSKITKLYFILLVIITLYFIPLKKYLCFTKTDLSVKTENDKVETIVKLNDDQEKIKETITVQPGDKVKVCLEESDDNSKYCQTIMSLSQYYQLNQSKLYYYHQYVMRP